METWPSSASTLMFFQYNVQVLFFFGRYWTWVNLNYIKCLSGYWQWLMADHPSMSWSCQDTGDRMAADEGHASVNANFWHSNTPHYINEKVEQTHSILFDKWAFLTFPHLIYVHTWHLCNRPMYFMTLWSREHFIVLCEESCVTWMAKLKRFWIKGIKGLVHPKLKTLSYKSYFEECE